MQPTDPTNLNWMTVPNEMVTVSETHSATMPGVNFTLDEKPVSTPSHTFQMETSGARVFGVLAHFSGTPNEECKVTVSGSAAGNATKTIRQPTNSSFGD